MAGEIDALEATNAELRAVLRKVELLEHVKMHLGKLRSLSRCDDDFGPMLSGFTLLLPA
jgi:hypothetical protein